MADEPHQPQTQAEPRREPPLIEGEAIRSPEPSSAARAPAQPSRLLTGLALLLGVAGTGLGIQGFWDSQQADLERQALRESIAQLQARPGPALPALASAPEIRDLSQKITALEQRPQPPSQTPAIAALTQRMEQLDRALSAVQDATKALASPTTGEAPSIDLGPLLGQLRSLDERLSKMERELKDLAARPRDVSAETSKAESASLAVVAQAIQQAVEHAQPIAALLDMAQSLGAPAQRIEALRKATQNGVASTSALARSWQQSSRAALDSLQDKTTGDASVIDRLKASASQLVRVRPVGEILGEDPASLMARIETSLAQGAVTQAYAAWQKLPEAARAASKSFGEMAQKRVAAEEAARAFADSAMKVLTTKAAP